MISDTGQQRHDALPDVLVLVCSWMYGIWLVVRSKPLDSSILKHGASTRRLLFFSSDMSFPNVVCGVLFFLLLYTSDPSPRCFGHGLMCKCSRYDFISLLMTIPFLSVLLQTANQTATLGLPTYYLYIPQATMGVAIASSGVEDERPRFIDYPKSQQGSVLGQLLKLESNRWPGPIQQYERGS